ncbi:Putative esterase [Mucilaginibacter gossypiicola]|uniref:Putative esterase n=1 Tax=Mucilaginibacter gossypiicola TaxID=551995 RepID=A0A1H8TLT3_9SPHI|nr:alpha/beta hydrolase-fold protein [Mucilaginibacter gossypiicola]SEO91554.1 Putative esterase [Mucilaginibacter gossypiicola]
MKILNQNKYLNNIFITLLFSCFKLNGMAQTVSIKDLPRVSIDQTVNTSANSSFEKLINEIHNFNNYPSLDKFTGEHIFFMQDSVFGNVPFKLYIPENYDPSQRHTVILLLHGAVGQSKFSDAENSKVQPDDDPFYSKLCNSNFIVVKPFADPGKGFDWAANSFGGSKNYTFSTLENIIYELKKTINFDDSKVFVFGHSDGSDGAFAFDLYKPTIFAGMIAYNSKLSNIFAHDLYIANAVNRPLRLVHSDKDDIRPIQQTRDIVKILDSLHVPLEYKEYFGYTHEDKHLDIDYPNSIKFITNTFRNPYPKQLYWETSNSLFEGLSWIEVNSWDLNLPRAAWHKIFNLKAYNKKMQSYFPFDYYKLDESAAIKAEIHNNTINILTSRITKFTLLISPKMLDLNKQISVVVNNKELFKKLVKPDKNFYLGQLKKSQDKSIVWVNSITINLVN